MIRWQIEVLQRRDADGTLFRGTDDELRGALDAGRIVFHEGCIGGAWPQFR